ncbi:recombinase family protein, partial [Neolewinella maritima]|uniref:recombinase family protein n=1 Tax=Neolewinella maritima TaxID=1383882 RepID=UPI001EE95BE9
MSKITDHHRMMPLVRVSSKKQDQGSNECQDNNIVNVYRAAVPTGKVMNSVVRIQSGRERDPAVLDELHTKLARSNRGAVEPLTLVMVDTWDRYFRNVEAGWFYIRKFQKIGVEVNCATRWIDFDDPYSKRRLGDELAQAEQASNDISQRSKTRYAYHVKDGTYCAARVPGIFRRRWITRLPKVYVIDPTDRLPVFQQAVALILGGVGVKAAWEDRGGRDVLGSEDSFRELLTNEIIMGRYRGQVVAVPFVLDEATYHALQRELARRKPVSRAGKTLHKFYLKPSLLCPKCGKVLTSDPAKSGRNPYYTCFHSQPRHYRIPIAEVHQPFDEMLAELTLQADVARLAGKRAVERSERDRAGAEADVKRLRGELKKQQGAETNALFLLADGTISAAQFKLLEGRKAGVAAELRAAEAMLEAHGRILENVLQSLQRVGMIFKQGVNRIQLSHFTRMAFPDGLVFDRKNRTFRTTSLNAALGLIPELSGSCTKLKTRPPSLSESDRVMSG